MSGEICRVPKYSETLNNPLHFHDVHGENIKLSKNKTVASRTEGFNNGVVFSDRPVALKEPVYVKFLETLPGTFHGALRIGFTMNDPVSFKNLPEHTCSEKEPMHFTWAKPIKDELAKKDSILYYYVDQNGNVHYGIDSDDHGILYGGIKTSGKLWAVLDIYGSTVAVEFLVAPSATKMKSKSNPLNSSFVQTETTSAATTSNKSPAKASRKRKNQTVQQMVEKKAKSPSNVQPSDFADIPLPKMEQKQMDCSCKLKTGEKCKCGSCSIRRCNDSIRSCNDILDKQYPVLTDFYNKLEIYIQKRKSGPDTINKVPSPVAQASSETGQGSSQDQQVLLCSRCRAELQDREIVEVQPFGSHQVPVPSSEVRICDQPETERDVGVLPGEGNDSQA